MSVRLGLIGAGRWGKRYIQTIEQLSDISIAYLCTSKPENAKLFLKPVKVVSDWKSLVSALDVDGVIISTPAHTHAEMVHACLEAKKPVMVEKPLCVTLAEALEIEKHAKSSGVPVLVDHTQIFQPAHEKLLQEFSDPSQIRFLSFEGQAYGPFRKNDISVLWDWAPHDVGVCLDLMKRLPSTVSCFGASTCDHDPLRSEVITLKLVFPGGTLAWIKVGRLSVEKIRKYTIFGKDQAFLFDDLAPNKLMRFEVHWENRWNESQPIFPQGEPVKIPTELPLSRAVKQFAKGIRGTPSSVFGVDLAVKVTRVLDAADRSLKNHSQEESV